MRRIIATAALLTVLPTAAANAQFSGPTNKTPLQLQEEEKRRLRQEDDKNYQAAARKRAGQAATTSTGNDPWASVRSAPGPAKQ